MVATLVANSELEIAWKHPVTMLGRGHETHRDALYHNLGVRVARLCRGSRKGSADGDTPNAQGARKKLSPIWQIR